MAHERLKNPEDPELLRVSILETLPKYQIHPDGIEIPGLSYGPDYIEFIHKCHDHGDRFMRVQGNEVHIEGAGLSFGQQKLDQGFTRIDTIDRWEAFAGYFVAMMYDPRWLLERLKDLKTEQTGNHKTLKGNLHTAEYLPTSVEQIMHQLERQSKEQIIQDGQRSADTHLKLGFMSQEQYKQRQTLLEEYAQLPEEELRQRVVKDYIKPWEFVIGIDEKNLPISVTSKEALGMMDGEMESVRFSYTQLTNT